MVLRDIALSTGTRRSPILILEWTFQGEGIRPCSPEASQSNPWTTKRLTYCEQRMSLPVVLNGGRAPAGPERASHADTGAGYVQTLL